jgi:hypothetical protein
VLDHVERRRFLVEPTGKDPAPLLVGALDVELNERAGQLFGFPRGSGLARPKPHDHVLPPRRLAGVENDVLDDPITLVEDAEHGDALRHRRHSTLPGGGGRHLVRCARRILLAIAPVASGQGDERQSNQHRSKRPHRAYSGTHGS